jgi:hypothetical protein
LASLFSMLEISACSCVRRLFGLTSVPLATWVRRCDGD